MTLKSLQSITSTFDLKDSSIWHQPTAQAFQTMETSSLTSFIYQHCFLGLERIVDTKDPQPRSIVQTADSEILEEYERVVGQRRYPDSDWLISRAPSGETTATKNRITLKVRHTDILFNSAQRGSILMPCMRPHASKGFFAAYSRFGPADLSKPANRIYINCPETAAAKTFGIILEIAESLALPVTIKIGNCPQTLSRPDSLVAYIARPSFTVFIRELRETLLSSGTRLSAHSPALTEGIIEGVSWAEDPISDGISNQSFGQHRSRLIAEGMIKAAKKGCNVSLWSAVKEHWKASGLSVQAPHLSPAGTYPRHSTDS